MAIEQIIANFEEANPDIEIVLETLNHLGCHA